MPNCYITYAPRILRTNNLLPGMPHCIPTKDNSQIHDENNTCMNFLRRRARSSIYLFSCVSIFLLCCSCRRVCTASTGCNIDTVNAVAHENSKMYEWGFEANGKYYDGLGSGCNQISNMVTVGKYGNQPNCTVYFIPLYPNKY